MSLLKKVNNTLSSGTNGMSQNGTKSANGNVKFIREERFALLPNSIPSVIPFLWIVKRIKALHLPLHYRLMRKINRFYGLRRKSIIRLKETGKFF